jgi:hypothetical protein
MGHTAIPLTCGGATWQADLGAYRAQSISQDQTRVTQIE